MKAAEVALDERLLACLDATEEVRQEGRELGLGSGWPSWEEQGHCWGP